MSFKGAKMDKKVALQLSNTLPLEDYAKAMADAGFKYYAISFNDYKPLVQDDYLDYINNIKKIFLDCGLKCVQTHAPYYNLLVGAEVRDIDIEKAIFRSIEATKILGGEVLAVHPRSFIIENQPRETAVDREKSLKENVISFKPLALECEKQGVLLGIENLMKYPNEYPYFYSWMIEDHIELINALDSDSVCAVWDFGHANLVEVEHAERINLLGNKIKATHVHNNAGWNDEHLPPFLPPKGAYYAKRIIDWDKVLKALKNTNYSGYLTLEVVFNDKCPLNGYLSYLFESVLQLYDTLEGE